MKYKIKCITCGEIRILSKREFELRSGKYCSHKCYSIDQRGKEKHYSKKRRKEMSKMAKKICVNNLKPCGHKNEGAKIKLWIKNHNNLVKKVISILKQKFRCFNLTGKLPDIIAINFKNKKVYGIEIGKHSQMEIENNFPYFDKMILIKNKYYLKRLKEL